MDGKRQINPIRLGPGRKPALSLASGEVRDRGTGEKQWDFRDGSAIDIPDRAAEMILVADWHAIARAAGLTRAELRILRAYWRDGLSVRQVATLLDIGVAKAGKLCRIVEKKLAANRPCLGAEPVRNSRRLTFRERRFLVGGLGPWSLSPLGPEFREIMDGEKNYISYGVNQIQPPTDTPAQICPVESRRLCMVDTIDTAGKLAAAEKRFRELSNYREQVQAQFTQARIAFATARDSLKAEREQALIADRPVAAAVLKIESSASAAVETAEQSVQTAEGAVERQAAKVQEIKGEIEATRLQRARAATAQIWCQLKIKQDEMMNLVMDGLQTWEGIMGRDLYPALTDIFPYETPTDPITDSGERGLRNQLYYLGYQLDCELRKFGKRKGREAAA